MPPNYAAVVARRHAACSDRNRRGQVAISKRRADSAPPLIADVIRSESGMSDLAVYIQKNHIEVVNLKDTKVATGSASFTTTRLLVGD